MPNKKFSMHVPWAIYWYSFIFIFVASNLFAQILPDWWFLMLYFGLFLSPELVGAIRKGSKGDTLSESIWTFVAHKFSRKLFAVGFAYLLCYRLYLQYEVVVNLFGNHVIDRSEQIAWMIFCVSICCWLTGHFYFMGKKG